MIQFLGFDGLVAQEAEGEFPRGTGEKFSKHLAHRLAWLYVHGEWPAEEIDHLNRVRSDNRISNLRLATQAENKQNTSLRRDSTSGHKGVSWHKRDKKWVAEIKLHGKKHYLGYFNNINDAIAARKSEESRLHPFAAA